MRVRKRLFECALVLGAMCAIVSRSVAQQTTDDPEQHARVESSGAKTPLSPSQLPDSPGATIAKLQPPLPTQSSSQPSSNVLAFAELQAQQSQSQTQPAQKPVGTAAAEPVHASGIAASQPAGVAVAPVKQRRVRTIVIRVGAILGAGVAVGSVVALTAATSSRPPGAR